ncbi:MAG: cupin domain-containing protein, partial [Acidimicrobiia bacterium]
MVERKNIETPEEVRTFDRGRMELVWVGGTTVVRATFEPGFRWSECLRSKVGTDSCQLAHTGIILAGTLGVAPDEGDVA